RRSYKKGKRFEDEVAALYRVLGFDVKADTELSGVQIDLMIRQKLGGANVEFIVECKDKRITADERNQILAQQAIAQKKLPRHRWIAVSSQGFAADTRLALEESGVDCVTYAELLRELIPLDNYADGLVAEYEKEAERRWEGEDWFIRPDLMTDITYERLPALEHLSRWLGEERRNQLVILGDLGTGKTTLASFLAYNLARSFRDDPLRHPAPVLIPLKEVRKEFSLESIVINHFARRGLRDISFSRFEHLVRLGKVILLFDAFDEMADRIRWEDTQSNFRELSRAADWQGKVILTCRTHYFKDRTEQVKVIGEGPRLSETETDLYRELRQRSTAEVVFLQEFDDTKIQGYLRKARPKDHAADWKKIQEIYNLKDLATRPLLLDMVVKTLPKLKQGEEVNAAKLYNVYTNIWIDREESKGRKFNLNRDTKLALMIELAWRMWRDERQTVHYKELVPFVQTLVDDQKIEIGDEEIADVASEMQGASFLKRDDNGNFGFMHRSFGEFFVAKKIAAALSVSSPTVKEGLATEDPALADARATDTAVLHEVLNTRRYDQKTIFFLSQLDEADAMREPLQEILWNKFQPNVSENALQLLYWSARIRCGMEEEISDIAKLKAALAGRIPANANLQGAKLQEVVLEGADLTGADLMTADLTNAKLNHTTLDQVSFYYAQLAEASVENSSVREADFMQATLTKVSFLESDLTGSDFSSAVDTNYTNFARTIGSGLPSENLPGEVDKGNFLPIVQYAPNFAALAVSYSPDGSVIAAGGADGNVYVYRSEDGVLLRTLEGHTAQVNSMAFSPDGQTLASGSSDNSVKLWQVNSGKEIRSLSGHSHGVLSVAFSPDGQTLASGSDDNSVKLWQVNSGKEIRSL
ncbi:MAG TPA: pentapeptide repeat-containing protein, partial [Blastocatellia bacterium]|nr:pentapeptide repeat-containing protein [Blastocatellia bacterium]